MNCKYWHSCDDYEEDIEEIVITKAHLKMLASMIRCEYCECCSMDCIIAKNKQDYDEDLCLKQLIDYALENPTEK